MQFNEYQQLAERTANRGPEDTAERRFTNFAFGLAGETGEVIDCLKPPRQIYLCMRLRQPT